MSILDGIIMKGNSLIWIGGLFQSKIWEVNLGSWLCNLNEFVEFFPYRNEELPCNTIQSKIIEWSYKFVPKWRNECSKWERSEALLVEQFSWMKIYLLVWFRRSENDTILRTDHNKSCLFHQGSGRYSTTAGREGQLQLQMEPSIQRPFV